MLRSQARILGASLCTILALGTAQAQTPDSRQFYKTPTTTAEFWRYMNHEIELGHFALARDYLKALKAKTPTDEELLEIANKEGNSKFLRLLAIPELRTEAGPLVDRLNAATQRSISDPKKLDEYLQRLFEASDQQEKSYVISQLRRAGAAAVPVIIEALIRTTSKSEQHDALIQALDRMDSDTIPPLMAAMDVANASVKSDLLGVFRRRGDRIAVPEMWYYAAAKDGNSALRSQALETISYLLSVPADNLPESKKALTQIAERYYQHKVPLDSVNGPTVWRWDGKGLTSTKMSQTQAEEYFGLRYARQALQLDPAYVPAQIEFLSIVMDKAMERAGYDQPIGRGGLGIKEIATSINPELVMMVMRRALAEKHTGVVLACTRLLGEQADQRAIQPEAGSPALLVQALSYPDRRVQIAAADAILKTPSAQAPVSPHRVVEVLRRSIPVGEMPTVLIVDPNEAGSSATAAKLKEAGFNSVVRRTGNEALLRLAEAADIDAIVLSSSVSDPNKTYLIPQLRADINAGRLPILLTIKPDQIDSLKRQVEGQPLVAVFPESADSASLKRELDQQIKRAYGAPLSTKERRDFAAQSLEWLAKLARGELAGYDVLPAETAVLDAFQVKDVAPIALQVAGRLPTVTAQEALGRIVLDPVMPAELRLQASVELARNMQHNGPKLPAGQASAIQAAFQAAPDGDRLKAGLGLVLGSLKPDARSTGERLRSFVPMPLPVPAPTKSDAKEAIEKESR